MVAELLRLRLRILANELRRPPVRAIGVVIGWIAAIVGAWLVLEGASWISQHSDIFVIRASIAAGSWLLLAVLLLPMVAVRNSPLEPRALLGYPLSPASISIATFLLPLVGPAILLIPMSFAPVILWADEPTALPVAWAVVPLLMLLSMILLDLGRQAGVALRHRPRAAGWVDFGVAVVLVVGLVIVLIVLSPRISDLRWLEEISGPVRDLVHANLAGIATTPFGVLWAAAAEASVPFGDADAAWPRVWFGIAAIVALGGLRFGLVHRQLAASVRAPAPRRVRIPGWFARFPANPVGAVSARSTTYWVRDPRYYATLGIIPVVPILMMLAFWVGGVPFEYAVLVPLPVLTLLVAWATMHNDLAFDSTAFWQHLSAQTRGSHDRQGRAMPVLAIGSVLLAIGIPLTVWAYGDVAITAPLAGVCIALLLGGVGVGSAYSARFPYAAPRPGDPAWQSPQVVGSQGGVAQAMSLLLALLVALPALVAAAAWWMFGGTWGWVSLAAGVVVGLAAFIAGVRGGGATIDRRGPELLAFTMRH